MEIMSQRLIKEIEKVRGNERIMLCFPYAGGGASFYYPWIKPLERLCAVCPIQLPGREERMGETLYTDIGQLARDIVRILKKYDNPLILFGHSLGTKMVFELEKQLEEMGRGAQMVIVSACPPPDVREKNPIAHLPDEEFTEALIRLNGVPKALSNEPEIMKIFLPMLRGDFKLSEGYRCLKSLKLQCPVRVMGGNLDTEASKEELMWWKRCNESDFGIKLFDGDHFYIKEHTQDVLREIKSYIQEV